MNHPTLSAYGRIQETVRHSLASSAACHEIASRTQRALMRETLDALGLYTDTGLQQTRTFLAAKSTDDIIAGHARVLHEFSKKLTGVVTEILGIQRQARLELSLCLEDCLRDA